jgi:integrase
MSDYLLNRNGHWYYFRRVPAHYAEYDRRKHITISLKTTDEEEARRRAIAQTQTLEAYWRDLVARRRVHGQDKAWQDAVAMARAHGFRYVPADDLAARGGLEDLLQRLHAVKGVSGAGTPVLKAVKGLLGTAGRPRITLQASLDAYFESSADRLVGKSDDFIRKWRNPRKRAMANFLAAVGDRKLDEVSRRDILDFRAWWLKRVAEEGHNTGTANKDFVHLKDVLRVLARENEVELDIPALFSEIGMRMVENSRSPFEASFVQKKILPNLSGLNDEARAVVLMMADTGARVNEIVGLLPEDIELKGKLPFIHIRPNSRRTLKNRSSARQIPLAGVAIEGARILAQGESRYRTADSASALINQYFENHGMKPTPQHSLYSLRHTFKDRLRDAGAQDEVIDNLMGHATDGPHYGRGHTLETKLKWLKKIAFKA